MVTTKAEALAQAQTKAFDETGWLEAAIEAKIEAGERVVVYLNEVKVSMGAALKLADTYRAAGWTVRIQSDQREGDYIVVE